MKEIWILFVLILSFFVYYFALESDIHDLRKIGDVGFCVFLFLCSFYILNIYMYHVYRMYFKDGRITKTIINITIPIVSLIIPLLILDKEPVVILNSYWFLIILIIIVFDINNSIKNNIVLFFEEKKKDKESDMFFKYPPNDLMDILFPLLWYVFLGSILYFIWKA